MRDAELPPRPADAFPSEEELCPDTDAETGVDISLIRENLKLTPWERILANDDTVNFCDMASEGLRREYATS